MSRISVASEKLRAAHTSSGIAFLPEDSPFHTVIVDITHRCNMTCRNCYIPVRTLPDMDAEWLYGIIARLPRRTRIRLVGAEPTLHPALPEMIRTIRELGHLPTVLTNGLKLIKPSFVEELKAAGLRTVHFSMNGGLRDDLYEAIDDMACAERKRAALDNMAAANLNVTIGMIIVPGINDGHLPEFMTFLSQRPEIRDIHLRSVGPIGRHMESASLSLDQLEALLRNALPADGQPVLLAESQSSRDFKVGRRVVQLTEWPDLGSRSRGRLTPEAMIEPFFENAIANANRY